MHRSWQAAGRIAAAASSRATPTALLVAQAARAARQAPRGLHAAAALADTASAPPLHSPYRLRAAVTYYPESSKVAKGGEDAYFVCPSGLGLGVADGVGGWAESGVDSGVYARLLMHNAAEYLAEAEAAGEAADEEECKLLPLRALVRAHSRTRVPGGSTALVLALRGRSLWAAHLGDSGFLLLRGGRVVFMSVQQQHVFNTPFQLSSSRGADRPTDAELLRVDVQPGDVVVAATDGLWDNLSEAEVAQLVNGALATGKGAVGAAEAVAEAARARGKDERAVTPFSKGAQRAGWAGWTGGKPDDVCVVAALVAEL